MHRFVQFYFGRAASSGELLLETFGGVAVCFVSQTLFNLRWNWFIVLLYSISGLYRNWNSIPILTHFFARLNTRLIRVSSFQKMLYFESPEIWRRVFNSRFYSKLLKKLIITKSDNNSNCTMSTYFSTQRVQVLLFFRPLIADQKGLTTEAVSKYDIHDKGWK